MQSTIIQAVESYISGVSKTIKQAAQKFDISVSNLYCYFRSNGIDYHLINRQRAIADGKPGRGNRQALADAIQDFVDGTCQTVEDVVVKYQIPRTYILVNIKLGGIPYNKIRLQRIKEQNIEKRSRYIKRPKRPPSRSELAAKAYLDGTYPTLQAASDEYGVTKQAISYQLRHGDLKNYKSYQKREQLPIDMLPMIEFCREMYAGKHPQITLKAVFEKFNVTYRTTRLDKLKVILGERPENCQITTRIQELKSAIIEDLKTHSGRKVAQMHGICEMTVSRIKALHKMEIGMTQE